MKAICLERSCEWANGPTKNCLWPRGCPKGTEKEYAAKTGDTKAVGKDQREMDKREDDLP